MSDVVRGVREVSHRPSTWHDKQWGWEAFIQNGDGSVACAHVHKSADAALRCATAMVKAGGHDINVADRPRRRRRSADTPRQSTEGQ